MHYVAGILLVVDIVLMLILDRTVQGHDLDYVAWATWLIAILLVFLPMSTLRRKGQVPNGARYIGTQALVDAGIYALVRHPQYLGWLLMYPVVFLFNPNWILAVVGLLGVACVYGFTMQEDQRLIEKFGEAYRRYMQRVPRFNLLAGIIRLLGDRGRS